MIPVKGELFCLAKSNFGFSRCCARVSWSISLTQTVYIVLDIQYKFINDNEKWLSDDEYRIDNWQHYWWWETEPALKFKEEVRKYRRTK